MRARSSAHMGTLLPAAALRCEVFVVLFRPASVYGSPPRDARRAFNRMHPASYVALDVNDLDTLRDALGEQHEAVSSPRARACSDCETRG